MKLRVPTLLKRKKKAAAKDGMAETLVEMNLRISGIIDGNQKMMQEMAEQRKLIGQVLTKFNCFFSVFKHL